MQESMAARILMDERTRVFMECKTKGQVDVCDLSSLADFLKN
jgi:hypothetical protein